MTWYEYGLLGLGYGLIVTAFALHLRWKDEERG